MTTVRFRSELPVPPERLFEFHADVRNLSRISPPFPPFRLVEGGTAPAREGDLQVFRLGWGPLGVTWEAQISRVVPGRLIEDTQLRGPFRRWRHQHRFRPAEHGAVLEDAVAFRLLPTPAGEFAEWLLVRPALLAMFWWRHRRTRNLLETPQES
jgi:ligand-binding SRPBCC domain-containing protein